MSKEHIRQGPAARAAASCGRSSGKHEVGPREHLNEGLQQQHMLLLVHTPTVAAILLEQATSCAESLLASSQLFGSKCCQW